MRTVEAVTQNIAPAPVFQALLNVSFPDGRIVAPAVLNADALLRNRQRKIHPTIQRRFLSAGAGVFIDNALNDGGQIRVIIGADIDIVVSGQRFADCRRTAGKHEVNHGEMAGIPQTDGNRIIRKHFREKFPQKASELRIAHVSFAISVAWKQRHTAGWPDTLCLITLNFPAKLLWNFIPVYLIIRFNPVCDAPLPLFHSRSSDGKKVLAIALLKAVCRGKQKFRRTQRKNRSQIPPEIDWEIDALFHALRMGPVISQRFVETKVVPKISQLAGKMMFPRGHRVIFFKGLHDEIKFIAFRWKK